VTPPIAIGYGFMFAGVVLLVLWRLFGHHERFFARKPFEVVDPAVATGEVRMAETEGLDE
jgi:hypothetical protein